MDGANFQTCYLNIYNNRKLFPFRSYKVICNKSIHFYAVKVTMPQHLLNSKNVWNKYIKKTKFLSNLVFSKDFVAKTEFKPTVLGL